MSISRKRTLMFVGLCAMCAIGLTAYLYCLRAKRKSHADTESNYTGDLPSPSSPRLFFRYTGPGENYGKLAEVSVTNLNRPRFMQALPCEVVHFAGGHGICLQTTLGVLTNYVALVFDADFKVHFRIPLRGIPSRTRVSPNGTLGAVTVFLSGHSYASLNFSTETVLIEISTGQVLASLERDLHVTRNGQPFVAQDFNFWGVTFAPDLVHFYCTLSSNQQHYLLEVKLPGMTAKVIHENVECPSVSPDGSRVAYKKRLITGGRLVWQLHILDLATGIETPLSENRSVDDQLEWLDNDNVLYAVSDNYPGTSDPTSVWKVAASGTGQPVVFLHNAFSPAVVR